MIIPSSTHGVIASSRPRVVVAVGDVTPNAVNWEDASGGCNCSTNEQTITGINTAINLVISWSVSGFVGEFFMYKNATEFDLFNNYSNPATFSISNNDIISFYVSGSACSAVENSVTVTNASDGNAVLDTFTMNTFGGGG
jgi:hypothetical protein